MSGCAPRRRGRGGRAGARAPPPSRSASSLTPEHLFGYGERPRSAPADGGPMLLEPLQCTLADGVQLSEVTFVVVDLETTGGSPTDHAINGIGAGTYRGCDSPSM